jgi:hypothetical protein
MATQYFLPSAVAFAVVGSKNTITLTFPRTDHTTRGGKIDTAFAGGETRYLHQISINHSGVAGLWIDNNDDAGDALPGGADLTTAFEARGGIEIWMDGDEVLRFGIDDNDTSEPYWWYPDAYVTVKNWVNANYGSPQTVDKFTAAFSIPDGDVAPIAPTIATQSALPSTAVDIQLPAFTGGMWREQIWEPENDSQVTVNTTATRGNVYLRPLPQIENLIHEAFTDYGGRKRILAQCGVYDGTDRYGRCDVRIQGDHDTDASAEDLSSDFENNGFIRMQFETAAVSGLVIFPMEGATGDGTDPYIWAQSLLARRDEVAAFSLLCHTGAGSVADGTDFKVAMLLREDEVYHIYEVTGLPAGLFFDAATRKIGGTTAAVESTSTVTYKATDFKNTTTTMTFSFVVELAPTVQQTGVVETEPLIKSRPKRQRSRKTPFVLEEFARKDYITPPGQRKVQVAAKVDKEELVPWI